MENHSAKRAIGTMTLWGKRRTVYFAPSDTASVTFDGDVQVADNGYDPEKVKALLSKFAHSTLKTYLHQQLDQYSGTLRVKPKKVLIRESYRTWGTCDSKGTLTFNLKLVHLPVELVDYVVVHELSHLVHLNHDRSFWRLVGKIVPDYKARDQMLSHYVL